MPYSIPVRYQAHIFLEFSNHLGEKGGALCLPYPTGNAAIFSKPMNSL